MGWPGSGEAGAEGDTNVAFGAFFAPKATFVFGGGRPRRLGLAMLAAADRGGLGWGRGGLRLIAGGRG
ncbi:hypothetical protein A4R43_40170 [Amycolatopsis albispora]|uniref:Uncharacterized protein n=1 Tax=Amycolatopsis albispora TaxID=1804986 RepID=A0A344LIN2_9PSEU|nr:hypothetical protein A4R43_40170 [Amycolatopsis albispora]